MAIEIQNPPANAEDVRDASLIPGWDDLLEEGMATHSDILAGEFNEQRRLQATVHRGAKSWT